MPIHRWMLAVRRRWVQAAIFAGSCLLALGYLGFWLLAPIPAGVQAGGVELSGLPRWKAERMLQEALRQTLYAQPLQVILPEETLTLSPESSGVKVNTHGVLNAARRQKQGGEISLRPYLRVRESKIREWLSGYAARYDTQFREWEWHLEGPAPELATDRFVSGTPGQTLVVTVGYPSVHLDTDAVYDAILDAFSQSVFLCETGNYAISPEILPEKVPELPDAETLVQQVYLAPVSDVPDLSTGGILPGAYGRGVDRKKLETALAGGKPGQRIAVPLEYIPPQVVGQEALFQDVLGSFETKHNTNENRNNNLRLLCQALDGYILQPGETFSYNQAVGERTKERGYLPAPAYSGNRLTDAVGGGVCQGSTTLYNCVLLADLEVVFRACHGAKVTYVPPGLDATVNWLTTDFQFRNQFRFPVKISAEVSDGFVKM